MTLKDITVRGDEIRVGDVFVGYGTVDTVSGDNTRSAYTLIAGVSAGGKRFALAVDSDDADWYVQRDVPSAAEEFLQARENAVAILGHYVGHITAEDHVSTLLNAYDKAKEDLS